MQPDTACELVARCAGDRDEDLWTELLRRYHTPLASGIRCGLRRAGRRARPGEAEDLMQEVYCRLLDRGARHLAGVRGGEDAIRAYLFRLAERVVLDELRAGGTAKRRRTPDDRPAHWTPEEHEGVVDPSPSPEDRLLRAERRRQLLERLAGLVDSRSRRDVWILELALLHGLTSREIAQRLGGRLAPSTIDTIIVRLRQRLADQGFALPRRPV